MGGAGSGMENAGYANRDGRLFHKHWYEVKGEWMRLQCRLIAVGSQRTLHQWCNDGHKGKIKTELCGTSGQGAE